MIDDLQHEERVYGVTYDPETGRILMSFRCTPDQVDGQAALRPNSMILLTGFEVDANFYGVEDGQLVTLEPTVDLQAIRAEAVVDLERAAEAARCRFVTPGSAKAMVYMEKRAEAELVVAADNPEDLSAAVVPLIAREAQNSGVSKLDVAVVVLTMAELWRTVAPVIEELCANAKGAIQNAETPDEVYQAADVVWPAP